MNTSSTFGNSVLIALLFFASCAINAKTKYSDFVWSSTDIRFRPHDPVTPCKQPMLYAWRGERVNLQAAFTSHKATTVSVTASDLTCGSHSISASCITCSFAEYIVTDGYYKSDSSMVADCLLAAKSQHPVASNTVCPIWITIWLPQDATPGKYTGTIAIDEDGQQHALTYSIRVSKRVLPLPHDWTFHLDLWQNPYAVARFFDVPLWSKEHFDLMRPIMQRYANAGGKVITTSITYHPWNGQTYDPFESMIVKTRHIDGKWTYDYTVFDRWVEFMMSCGVTEQISCYTIVPWNYEFEYLDQATASTKYLKAVPGDKQYEAYMLPFLTDLARHLKAKGWFSRTTIAMDERPVKALETAWDIVQRADTGYRIEGAMNYKPATEGVVNKMYGISTDYNHVSLPSETIARRKKKNRITTIYTCCSPEHPNTFTFSPPAEAAFIGWHIAAMNYDGYLRWALNSWGARPEKDSRFGNWPGGDAWLLYPNSSSIRWERLVEGIQAYEKIRILRASGDKATNRKIDKILQPFTAVTYDEATNAADEISKANEALRAL